MLSPYYKLSPKLFEELNKHMLKEFYSAYLYLSAAHHFKINNMKGCACWFDEQSKEEYEHAIKFLDLFKKLKVDPSFDGIPQVTTNWNGYGCTRIIEFALQHEKAITKSIHDLFTLAHAEGNVVVCSLLKWFIKEQLEEEGKFIDIHELSKSLQSNLPEFDEILMEKAHKEKHYGG
jgi:ferritin